MWLFWITIVFALVYLVLYPGLGNFAGVLGWTSTGAYATRDAPTPTRRLKPLYDKYLAMDLPAIAADPQARAMGERHLPQQLRAVPRLRRGRRHRAFRTCATTTGSTAARPSRSSQTITDGRMGVMPALGATLGDEGVKDVAAYVRSLSGLPQRHAEGAARQADVRRELRRVPRRRTARATRRSARPT